MTIGSNFKCDTPADQCQRWSNETKSRIAVSRPKSISSYNRSMGGTDNMDQAINGYKPTIRNRKWYWPLFVFILQVGTYNAWKLSRKSDSGRNNSFLSFLRYIVTTYLTLYKTARKKGKTNNLYCVRGVATRVPESIRYDGIGHSISNSGGSRTRCALCHNKTTYECVKCGVKLHTKCFATFHGDRS